ncbi:MAG: ABC transporter ATP-binding protein [Bacillota bacterium]
MSKVYGAGAARVQALADVSLSVTRGEFLAVTGPSGSGKSTLLHLLGLLDVPTSGSIRICGRDASQMTEREKADVRRLTIGFVFQMFHLVPFLDVLDNVRLPLLPYRAGFDVEGRARELLTRVGLERRLHHLPHQLSIGEQQRVALARALINHPQVVLADEPTGNLDTSSRDAVLDLLGSFHREGLTIVVVTHDPEVAARAKRIVRIRDGRLIVPES